jgi:hypothetical protein
MLKRGYLFFVCVFILSPLLFFSSCEEVDAGTEKVESKDNKNESVDIITSKEKKEKKEKKDNSKVINGILLDVKGMERVNESTVAISLYVENQGDEEEYISGCFSAMDTVSKKVIEQEYSSEFKDNIANLSDLPPDANWEGSLYFTTKSNKVTLFYDNFLSGKKKFLLEIVK